MAILSRVRIIAQERLDLEDWNAEQSSQRTDSKFFMREFFSNQNYILKGFKVSGIGLKAATVDVTKGTLINANGSSDFSWFVVDDATTSITVTDAELTDGVRNYLELELYTETGTPVTKALWDPAANGGLGAEFNQQIDTTTDLAVRVVSLTGGFSGSADRIKLAIVDVNGSGDITGILDKRDMFGRLGTGADSDNEFTWASRVDPEVTLTISSPVGTYTAGEVISFTSGASGICTVGGTTSIKVNLLDSDSIAAGDTVSGADSGATGTLTDFAEAFIGADKDIDNIKEMFNALATEIKSIKGTRLWFENAFNSANGISEQLNSIMVQNTAGAKFTWDGSDLTITDGSGTPADADVLGLLRLFSRSDSLNLTRQDGTGASAVIPVAEDEVLFIKLPSTGDRTYTGVGSSDTNYQTADIGSYIKSDENYWLAYRKLNRLYIRGYGELEAGEEIIISDPQKEDLEASIAANLAKANQDRNIKLIEINNGPVRLVDNAGTYELTLTADAYVTVPDISKARNTIAAQQIDFPNANSAAYVAISRVDGAPVSLTVSVADIDSITISDDTYVFARRVSNGVLVDEDILIKLDRFTDNSIVRRDDVYGETQDSNVTISDTDVVDGVTQLNVDNLRLDGNTVSSTDVNGNITASPNGTGRFISSNELQFQAAISTSVATDSSTTGANQTLSLPLTEVVRLTNASLTSVDMITAAVRAQKIILTNHTGNPITINNETGATAANQIQTGTKTNITVSDQASIALFYDLTEARWMVIGGTGSGGSGEGFNYISGGDAEAGVIGWVVYANTTAGNTIGSVPAPDDFGGTPSGNLTWTQNATTPLIDNNDFKLAKTASNVQGEGVYYEFTNEKAHETLQLLFRAYADLSELDDGDVSIWLLSSSDSFTTVDNYISAPNPEVLVGKIIAKQMQLDDGSKTYRLCIHYGSTDVVAKNAYFDGLFFGPKDVASSVVITDWEDWTPTGNLTTNVTYTGKKRRVGDVAEYQVEIEFTGTNTQGAATVNLPSGEVIDTNKVNTNGTGWIILGQAGTSDASGSSRYEGTVRYTSTTSVTLNLVTADTTYAKGGTIDTSIPQPITFASGDYIRATFRVPITGWSSNARISEDLGNRDIIIEGSGNGGALLTGGSTDIDFTETRDTTSAWNGTQFTAPETGDYVAIGAVRFTAGVGAAIYSYIDTGGGSTQDKIVGFNGATTASHPFSWKGKLNKGDVLSFRSDTGGTLSNNTVTHWINISKDASSQSLLESEIVACRYVDGSGQTFTINNQQTVTWDTLDYDTHNAMNGGTGVYTIPVSGKYIVFAKATLADANITATDLFLAFLKVNGNPESKISFEGMGTNASTRVTISAFDILDLNKGDTVEFDIYQGAAGATEALITDTDYNVFSIARIKS